jgi:hypothetical protein
MKNLQGGLRFPGFPPVAYVIMQVRTAALHMQFRMLQRSGCRAAEAAKEA